MNIMQRRATIVRTRDLFTMYRLYRELSLLEEEYPEFPKWYFDKVIPETIQGKRQIFVAYLNSEIAGILIVKDSEEKKICTLRVLPQHRNLGIGHQLMDVAIDVLSVEKPLITVADTHISEFLGIFRDYEFAFSELHCDLYTKGHSEYVFNGSLNCN